MMYRVRSHKENSVCHFAQRKESFLKKMFEIILFPKMSMAWIKRDCDCSIQLGYKTFICQEMD